MGLPAARISDVTQGICYDSSHDDPYSTGGIIISGSPDVFENGLCAAGVGDTVLSYCGHIGVIISGAPAVYVNGKNHARIGDLHSGTFQGTIITGSGNVFA